MDTVGHVTLDNMVRIINQANIVGTALPVTSRGSPKQEEHRTTDGG